MSKSIGIIQVRGIGDAIIAMPIAQAYFDLGHEVAFALDDRFCESFSYAFPDIIFKPVPFSEFKPELGISNPYWYELPKKLLMDFKIPEQNIISFPYHESHMLQNNQIPEFMMNQIKKRISGPYEQKMFEMELFNQLKFDEFKYATADVPFEYKWKLRVNRNEKRESILSDRFLSTTKKNVVMHLEGSNIKLEPSIFENLNLDEYNVINITGDITNNLFDWIGVLEKSDVIVTLDSVFTNLIDQLRLPNTKYFIKRSGINMTPVLGSGWQYLRIPQII